MMTMDGWIFQLLKTNHRCWFVRGCSILIASLLCMSCGKKIEDKNRNKVKANKTNITPQESQLKFILTPHNSNHSANHFIEDRFFYKIPHTISASSSIQSLTIFFNVLNETYEYLCDFVKEDEELIFQKCLDDEGYTIEHLVPDELIHLPSQRNLYLEAKVNSNQNIEFIINILNK